MITGKINKYLKWMFLGIEVRRWINKCPLIIFADKRIERVIGRIILLIVSINTINIERAIGDPIGTKWIIILLKCIVQPYIIKENHKGNARIIEKIMCLDGVKTKGIRPIKFDKKIIINKDINKIINLWLKYDKLVLISLKMKKKIFFQIIWIREGMIQ